MEQSPRHKRPRNHFTVQDKQTILNDYLTYTKDHPQKTKSACVDSVAHTLGICASSVYKILQENNVNKEFVSPKKFKKRKTVLDKIDDDTKNKIKRIVHSFFLKNEIPTLDKILRSVNESTDITLKRSTLWSLLKDLNFQPDTGEASNQCVICQSTFQTQAELTGHIMIHAGNVWYKCVQCSKCFDTKDNFNNHINRHKIQNGEKSQGITSGVYLEIKLHECDTCESPSQESIPENDETKEQEVLTEFIKQEAFDEQIEIAISENSISQNIKTECVIDSAEYNSEPTESDVNINNQIKTEIDIEDIKIENNLF